MSNVAVKIPLSSRINIRMILFAGVVCFLIGAPMWIYVKNELTHGITLTSEGYAEVDFKTMVTFEFDQAHGKLEDVPERFRKLDGKPVILRGEIAPTTLSARGANQFDLVYSVSKCCVSGKPLVQHFVQSQMANGGPFTYYSGLIEVRGILHVDVTRDQYQVNGVYQLEVESMKPVM